MANEKRLIDANVVLAKQFTAGLSDASGNYYGHADVVIVDEIENVPTVDAVEVVHGRWVFGTANHREYMKCSECLHSYTPDGTWCYCPNCGAKMGGDGNGS